MSWVTEQVFAAGGTMIPCDWARFKLETGIDAVLHMNPVAPTPFEGPDPERFLWLDAADEEGADLAMRKAAGRFIFQAVHDGYRVLLHATPGRHRARWAYVAYLILDGRRPASAVRMAAEQPWLAPYSTDMAQWEAFYRSLHGSQTGGLHAV